MGEKPLGRALVQSTEAAPKSKIANDIESVEFEPAANINRLPLQCIGIEFVQKILQMDLNDCFELHYSLHTVNMGCNPALLCMLCLVDLAENRGFVNDKRVIVTTFVEVVLPISEDLLDGFRMAYKHGFGAYTDHIAEVSMGIENC